MKDRIKTLLLYSNGPPHWKPIVADTVLRGLLRLQEGDALASRLLGRRLASRALRRRYEVMSYMHDWQDAFCSSPELDVETCNIVDLVDYVRARPKIKEYPFVVVLHSAAGDDLSLLRKTENWFQGRQGKLLAFLGNEYQLMPDKIGFLRAVGADYIGSQLPLDAAQWLYAECDQSQILAAPHALNPQAYRPDLRSTRPIDIGFVGDDYPFFVGDRDRARTVQFFEDQASTLRLRCDIRSQRMPRADWARFLNQCKATVGAESGTYYLERTDRTIHAVQAYLREFPQSTFNDIFERFFRDYPDPVSGKAISSRHFEPIGTQTSQILLEGRYNDILVADKHYIALKKDFSNIQDVMQRFKDDDYRTAMARETYEYVLDEHTYQHRVRSLIAAMFDT
jgi:hypothetical protein